MIAVIRITGMVEVNSDVQETLFRMLLRRKYALVLLNETPENLAKLKKVRNLVAYGNINKETLVELIKKRGQALEGKKIDAEKVASELSSKDIEDLGLKPFFRLHPPRGGIDSKIHFGTKKGVLGDNGDKINDLIRRML